MVFAAAYSKTIGEAAHIYYCQPIYRQQCPA